MVCFGKWSLKVRKVNTTGFTWYLDSNYIVNKCLRSLFHSQEKHLLNIILFLCNIRTLSFSFVSVHVNVCVWCMCAFVCVDAYGGPNRVSDLLKLELQTVVNHLKWILRTKLEFSARTSTILNSRTISLVLKEKKEFHPTACYSWHWKAQCVYGRLT